MSKPHPLAGLIANYGDSDDDSDDGIVHTPCAVVNKGTNKCPSAPGQEITPSNVAGIHPAPIPHCPWSACYDESSGFTYYWNQKTNAVTWEAPPEYLLALKIAQQHLHTSGTTEVSAEEWQLYQQALVDKQNSQNKLLARAAIAKISMKPEKPSAPIKEKKTKINKKRPASDDEEERIELITSYHNSDSESNDEAESSVVAPTPPTPKATVRTPKNHKRLKPRAQVEYGPAMPPNLDYSVPIGPELPPNSHNITIPKPPEIKPKPVGAEKQDKAVSNDCEDSQDEGLLLMRLKDKAKLLERLGGELPAELRQMFKDDTGSAAASPKSAEDAAAKISPDIDDLLQEIEKKEFAKTKQETEKEFSKPKTADSNERSDFKDPKSNLSSVANSPRSDGHRTPPLEELKALFPIVKSVAEPVAGAKVVAEPVALFPSANNAELVAESKPPSPVKPEKKNIYLTDVGEKSESRKRPRISNSVLPYTTRYAHVEGPAEPRTGLGFGTDVEGARVPSAESAVSTVSYGGGLTFTRGGTLNGGGSEPAEPAEPAAPDEPDEPALLETRLGQLCDMQPAVVPQLQRMLIELQTLLAARCAGALGAAYVRAWARRACSVLGPLEVAATAAPPGWTCAFHRSVGRYRYLRDSDGLQQWERPALDNTDMDISTTPPHPGIEHKQEEVAKSQSPPPAPPPPAPPSPRAVTPPPPKWPEPPPPGCDEPPPLPPEPVVAKEIGDELMSFYNDIAELEKGGAPTEPQEPQEAKDKERDKDSRPPKKKPKVKISTSMGLKHKSVSSLVAKWQQVAEEINSD